MSVVSLLRDWTAKFCSSAAGGLVVLAALAYTGCGSLPQTHYYKLTPPAPPSVAQTQTKFILQVERFAAPEIFRDDRIVYHTSPTELNFYQYQRWASEPAALLSELTARYLEETGLFEHVYEYPEHGNADFILRGRILNLEEVDYANGEGRKTAKGRVGLKLELLRTQDNKVVWSAQQQVERPIKKKGVEGVVGAINAASQQLLSNVFSSMARVVENESAQRPAPSQ